MPYCATCKEERGGKFCSSCGGRVGERRASNPPSSSSAPPFGGSSAALPRAPPPSSSPTACTSPTAAAASAPRAIPGRNSALRQSLSSLTDAPAQPSTSPPTTAPPISAPNGDMFGARKANVSNEAYALITSAAQDIPNTRRRELPVSVSSGPSSRITVAVRKRPLNPSETQLDVVAVRSLNGMYVLEGKRSVDGTQLLETHQFAFDEVFDETDKNESVYERTAKRLMDHIFNGGFCCCFAYGQTGSGKTYTMMGSGVTNQGIYLQAANEIFHRIEDQPLCVAVSFYEIYAAKLYDLLNNKEQIYSREDENQKVHIRGLTEHVVANSAEIMDLVKRGLEGRSSSTTVMNDESSRSHAIMEIKLKLRCSAKLIGKLSVIDLAGSERASVGHAGDKQVQMEGAEINKSLLALKECIRALDQGQRHIPFRQSELTQILKESFLGENGHTMMIANISCSVDSCAETLNTLRYADRVKGLKVPEDEVAAAPVEKRASNAGLKPSDSAGKGLAFADKKCSGCGSLHRNYAFLEAHKESCPLVTTTCDFCPTSFKRKDQDRHFKTCTKIPVTCKQCGEKVAREALKKHQNIECMKSETSCLFCRRKLLKDELEAHKNTCEQRMVDCDECDARVKVSLMLTHKKTCKKTKRDSLAPSTNTPSAPTAPTPSKARVKTNDTTASVSSSEPSPTERKASRQGSRQGSLGERASNGGDVSKSPSPTSRSAATTPTASSSAAPLRKKPSAGSALVCDSGGGACQLAGYGCSGGTTCHQDNHVSILMSLYSAQVQENTALKQDLASMDERLRRLEGEQDRAGSKFAALNGLGGLGGQ